MTHRAVVTNTGMESQWDNMTEKMETSLFAFYQCHTLIWMAYLPSPYRYVLSQINGIFSLKRCSPANRRGGLIIPRLLSIHFKSWWLWFRLWKSWALAQIMPPESVRFVLIDNYFANYEDIGKIRSSTILPAYTEQLLTAQNTFLFQLACPGRWQDQVPHRSFGKCHFLSSLLSMFWFWRDKNQALATGLYCPLLFSPLYLRWNLGADLSFLLLVWSNWERPKNPNCSDVWAPRMKALLSFQKPSKRLQLLDFFFNLFDFFFPPLFSLLSSFKILGIEHRASCMLRKSHATELHTQSLYYWDFVCHLHLHLSAKFQVCNPRFGVRLYSSRRLSSDRSVASLLTCREHLGQQSNCSITHKDEPTGRKHNLLQLKFYMT